MKDQFLLSEDLVFLNHGSFGACPKPVFENFQYWQRQLESDPVRFITQDAAVHLADAKTALGIFLGCDPNDFFFTQNPTVAINTVMRSLNLSAGDEILATSHEYGAMNRTWNFYSQKSGVKYVPQKISLPVISKELMLEEFWSGVTSRTKIIFVNQISSATALIFPVKEIVNRAKEQGILTIIDGAHVPGHIDLNISDLDPDFYTGTLHKWMLSPKGSSFLYVKKELQHMLDPLVVSWGFESETPGNSRFLDYHEQQGTRDISAFLATKAAIDFITEAEWIDKTAKCKSEILRQYPIFCDLLDSEPICPVSSEFLGQMCSIPIKTPEPMKLKSLLYDNYRIQIPVMKIQEQNFLRISLQPYNTVEDIAALYSALSEIKVSTELIR